MVCQDEFLIPVYFNHQVLVRYLYDSRFYCDFNSETLGTFGNQVFDISFGINSDGNVIMWLGDIKLLPKREQLYLIVENKKPGNNIHSDFYDAQIKAEFTEAPISIKCLNHLAKMNSLFHQKYGVFLYKEQSIEKRIELTRRYKRIILQNEDDFKRFISELNEIINENTDNTEIKRFLKSKAITFNSESKGNKLLEKVYLEILSDNDNCIAPFFYLYDLRLWSDHSIDKYLYSNVLINLGLSSTATYEEVLKSLFDKIEESCNKIECKINA